MSLASVNRDARLASEGLELRLCGADRRLGARDLANWPDRAGQACNLADRPPARGGGISGGRSYFELSPPPPPPSTFKELEWADGVGEVERSAKDGRGSLECGPRGRPRLAELLRY